MLLKNTAKSASLLALCALMGCAKAGYNEKASKALSGLSADNELVMSEGQNKTFTVNLTSAGNTPDSVHWRITSDKYNVNERFQVSMGEIQILGGQKQLQITVVAADEDAVNQGDQMFTLELISNVGMREFVPLLLKDLHQEPRGPVVDHSHVDLPKQERQLEFEVQETATQAPVKVIMIIDNSLSMKIKQDKLAAGIRDIAKSLAGKNLEFFLYSTTNDLDVDGHSDKMTTESVQSTTQDTITTEKALHRPFQDGALILKQGLSADETDKVIARLQNGIMAMGHTGSKNETALCTMNNIIHEKDAERKILTKGDDALFFILSDTDDHSADVRASDCGAQRKIVKDLKTKKIISQDSYPAVTVRSLTESLDTLLGRSHYGITTVISDKRANQGHDCGKLILDEGIKYTAIVSASPTPQNIYSICSSDYSEALESVNAFSQASLEHVFPIKLDAQERISEVAVIRDGKEFILNHNNFDYNSTKLRVKKSLLQKGDRIRVNIQGTRK